MKKVTKRQRAASQRNWNKRRLMCMKASITKLLINEQIDESEIESLNTILHSLNVLLTFWSPKPIDR